MLPCNVGINDELGCSLGRVVGFVLSVGLWLGPSDGVLLIDGPSDG